MTPRIEIDHAVYGGTDCHADLVGYEQLAIKAGPRGTERIVPPAGEEYAFDVALWARRVVISISPAGRSVRVWVDGTEVPAQ